MMQIVYFSHKDQFLAQMQSIQGEKIFITPSPAKADSLRSKLQENIQTDVITVAKFTSSLMEELWEPLLRPQVKRKADLLLIFGILKNKYLPGLGFEQFKEAYNLFSDLRSFTLDKEALSSILSEQAKELREAVELFWMLLGATGFLDEHGAYQAIAEELRSQEEKATLKKTYVFWGFQHLNGQQVDLLKALAIRYHVVIPFPEALKAKLKRSDWVSWLMDTKVEEVVAEASHRKLKARWLPINSREISHSLKEFLHEPVQVILGTSKLNPNHVDLVPHSEVNFKIPHSLVKNELDEFNDLILDEFHHPTTLGNFLVWIKSKKTECIKTPEKRKAPFKMLKAIQLYEEACAIISEMTDEQVTIDSFFQKLLKEVVSLNQPRNSYIPLLQSAAWIELKDMSSVEDIDFSRKILVCLDETFDEILSLGQNYTEEIQRLLSPLGPLKRNELELLFKQWEFENLIEDGDVTILMPESILKHNLVWKRLFNNIELEKIDKKNLSAGKKVMDQFKDYVFKPYGAHFTASRLQSFMDCPRKFYFSFVEPISPRLKLEKEVDPMLAGIIVHKIIEESHKRKLEATALPSLVKEIFAHFIRENSLSLSPETYRQKLLVLNHRSSNGIQFLKNLELTLGSPISWKIEEGFKASANFPLTGQMDCLGIGDNKVILLDFKSTKGSASSSSEVEAYESLQLWVYALATQEKISLKDQTVIIGYVTLDDPSESNLIISDEDLARKIKDQKLCRAKPFSEDFAASLLESRKKIDELMVTIKNETNFLAIPRKAQACHFCDLKQICLKGELIND